MVYKKYGQVFRKLRKQRGLPLIYFEPLGISKAALAKFECGETMMSFERLTLALQTLDVSLEEFEHHLNHFSLSNLEAISDDIFDPIADAAKDKHLQMCDEFLCNENNVDELLVKARRRMSQKGGAIRDIASMKNAVSEISKEIKDIGFQAYLSLRIYTLDTSS